MLIWSLLSIAYALPSTNLTRRANPVTSGTVWATGWNFGLFGNYIVNPPEKNYGKPWALKCTPSVPFPGAVYWAAPWEFLLDLGVYNPDATDYTQPCPMLQVTFHTHNAYIYNKTSQDFQSYGGANRGTVPAQITHRCDDCVPNNGNTVVSTAWWGDWPPPGTGPDDFWNPQYLQAMQLEWSLINPPAASPSASTSASATPPTLTTSMLSTSASSSSQAIPSIVTTTAGTTVTAEPISVTVTQPGTTVTATPASITVTQPASQITVTQPGTTLLEPTTVTSISTTSQTVTTTSQQPSLVTSTSIITTSNSISTQVITVVPSLLTQSRTTSLLTTVISVTGSTSGVTPAAAIASESAPSATPVAAKSSLPAWAIPVIVLALLLALTLALLAWRRARRNRELERIRQANDDAQHNMMISRRNAWDDDAKSFHDDASFLQPHAYPSQARPPMSTYSFGA